MAYVHLLLAIVAMKLRPLFHLDIKNGFLHGDLEWEIYIEQPFVFVCCSERVQYGMQIAKLFVWPKTIPLGMVWSFWQSSTTV